jgi:hypothetical protein
MRFTVLCFTSMSVAVGTLNICLRADAAHPALFLDIVQQLLILA